MKILFFTNEYAHPDLPAAGGAGSSIKILAHEMVRRGHEIHVFGFLKKKQKFNDNGVSVHFFKKYAKSHPLQEAARSLGSKLKLKKIELFFVEQERKYLAHKLKKYVLQHNIEVVECLAFNGYLAFWDNTVPLVVRFRGSRGFWHHYLGQPKEDLKILMEMKTLKATPYHIAVSEFSAKAIKNIYGINVKKVIHNGIDHHLFSPKDNISSIDQSLFYFGTLSTAKGVDVLCKIFNEIIVKYPKASLHIIGRGQDYWQKTCKKILSKAALDASKYYGPKNTSQLPELVQQAAVCVLPSRNETFGLVFIEAMALEKAVIASNIPSAGEIIDHERNGFIANGIDDYVLYISKLFNDDKLNARIGKAARVKVLENFTHEILVERTLEYYRNIVHQKIDNL